jgi:hydroxypyruvate reductase
MKKENRERLSALFRAAVDAADPDLAVRRALRSGRDGLSLHGGGGEILASVRREEAERIVLLGGGKAARAMVRGALAVLGDGPVEGVVAVPAGDGGTEGGVRLVEGGHPYPDGGSRKGAMLALSAAASASARDLVIALVSGGASALLSMPAPGLSAADKEATVRLLLACGASIAEVNTVRRHISMVKGGRLAQAAWPARVWLLYLSDVPGDDPSDVGSGPFSPDRTRYADALAVLSRRGILSRVPAAVAAHLEAGARGDLHPETARGDEPAFSPGRYASAMVGSNGTALTALSAEAEGRGMAVRLLPSFLEGEARERAVAFVSTAREFSASLPPGATGVVAAGGEAPVSVRGKGKGGRCQEFALAAAGALAGIPGITVLSAGTDGDDHGTGAAGAFADGTTAERAAALGLSPEDALAENDSHPVFAALGDLFAPGPTGTNVADLALALVTPGTP